MRNKQTMIQKQVEGGDFLVLYHKPSRTNLLKNKNNKLKLIIYLEIYFYE